ncbi:MAG: iron ABC transporter permease [Proteobacteria bacterium]|nr:iron ABC transporter permease [Pseudomonadota bacterium]
MLVDYLRRNIFSGTWSLKLFIGAVFLILIYLVGSPILCLLISSLKETGLPNDPGFTLSNYLSTYSDPYTYELFWNSFVFSIGSTSVALLLGITFAWLVERTDTPLRSLVRGMIISTMAIPPVILAVSWVLLLSPRIGLFNQTLMGLFNLKNPPFNVYSLSGMFFVQGLALVPTTFLMLSPAFRNMDPSLEEAASVSGAGMLKIIRTIVLPILKPAILSASIFVFVVGLVVFDIPGIIGLPVRIMVFSSQIFFATHPPSGLPEYGTVSALAISYLVVISITLSIYFRLTRQAIKFTTITGKGYRPRPFQLGKWGYVAFSFFILYILLAIVLPLGVLIWTSLLPYYSSFSLKQFNLLSLENYRIFLEHRKVVLAVKNTFVVAVVSATLVALLSFAVSWIVIRVRNKSSQILDLMAFIPLGIPHVLMGLALIYVYLTLKFIPIYGTIWIITLAYVTHYTSFGTRTMNGAMIQIHKDLEEASEISGASWVRTFLKITFPLVLPAMISVWVWVAGHAMRELSAALMLASGRNLLLSTLLWDFWEGGDTPVAATVGVVLIAFLVILMVVAQLLARRSRLRF